jgi:hypothetical protein
MKRNGSRRQRIGLWLAPSIAIAVRLFADLAHQTARADDGLYANPTQAHGIPGHWWKPWTTR